VRQPFTLDVVCQDNRLCVTDVVVGNLLSTDRAWRPGVPNIEIIKLYIPAPALLIGEGRPVIVGHPLIQANLPARAKTLRAAAWDSVRASIKRRR